jgi:hypothetical protein
MEYSQDKIDLKYDELPNDLKEAIESVEIGNLVAQIGEDNGLMLDQVAELMDQTTMIMLGVVKANDFVKNLSKSLEIDYKVAENISREINSKVFSKIRESIRKIQEGSEFDYDNVEPQTTPNQPQTTPQQPAPVTPPTPITPTPAPVPTTPPSTPTPPPTPTTPPVFVAKTIAIPKPEPISQPTIMPKTVEEAGRFTIERPPVGMPQYKETEIKKDVILGMIEDKEEIKTPTPITISTPSYIPEKPVINPQHPKPIQNTVIENKTINPEPPKQDLPKPPVVERKPYTVDPYREQI